MVEESNYTVKNLTQLILDRKKTFPSHLSSLQAMVDFVKNPFASFGFDLATTRKIELATEEALMNVIQHGYKGIPSGLIEIELKANVKEVQIVIRDTGFAFNPLEKKTFFDPLASLEDRAIGGLGIVFMRQYVDEISYVREGNQNVLTLIKKKYTEKKQPFIDEAQGFDTER